MTLDLEPIKERAGRGLMYQYEHRRPEIMTDKIAFDMSRFYRIIGTQGRIRGEFAVHGTPDRGVFKVLPLNVTIYDEDRSWGQGFLPGGFDVHVVDGIATVGVSGNESRDAVLDEVRDLMNELLAAVVAEFNATYPVAVQVDGSAPKGNDE